MDVFLIKLKTGEEILAELKDMDENRIVVKNPMHMIKDIEGQYHSIGYAVNLAKNKTVVFSNDEVLFSSFANEVGSNHYKSIFHDEDEDANSEDDGHILSDYNIQSYTTYKQ